MKCPTCSFEAEALGRLGNRIHYRCPFCGTEFSRQVKFIKARKADKQQALARRRERLFKEQTHRDTEE